MDSYFLTAGGTTVDIGSWTRADPGVDWGTHDLIRAQYAENAQMPGGRLAYETVGVRKLQFPLILPSGGAGLSLPGLESLLAILSRPGAVLDVQTPGVATGDMVRFDVLDGRWEPEPHVRHTEIGIRLGTLKLDTQPYAYLPTWIVLASTASVGLPGRFEFPNASLLGDIPGYGRILLEPKAPGETAPISFTYNTDMVAWSVGGHPSLSGFLTGASWTSALPTFVYTVTPTEVGVPAAGATFLRLYTSPTGVGWTQMAYYDIATALAPAHTGRYRAFTYLANDARLTSGEHVQLTIDAVNPNAPSSPMASAQLIATLMPQINGSAFQPQLLDLGDITLPPVGSGVDQAVRLRLWMNRASQANANTLLYLAGVHLLPEDGAHGIQPEGVILNRENSGVHQRWAIDGRDQTVVLAQREVDAELALPVADTLAAYRGGFPMIGATVTTIDLVGGERARGVASPYLTRVEPVHAFAHVAYQPRFLFLKGEV